MSLAYEQKLPHRNDVVELYADKAPESVDNFLGYVDSEFFDG